MTVSLNNLSLIQQRIQKKKINLNQYFVKPTFFTRSSCFQTIYEKHFRVKGKNGKKEGKSLKQTIL